MELLLYIKESKLIMEPDYEISEIQKFTVDQFQKDFDSLMERVEQGEVFIIEGENGSAIIVPYKETYDNFEGDEFVGIHTSHNDGS